MEADSEVVKQIMDSAVKAAGAHGKLVLVDAPLLGAGKSVIVKADGTYDIKTKEEARHHRLHDIEAVWKWCIYAGAAIEANPVLWVSEGGIRVVIDDADRTVPSPVIWYGFRPTPEYKRILQLATTGDSLDQKAFIRMLRSELYECLDPHKRDGWIKSMRSLVMSETGGGRSDVRSSGASYGRDIDMAVNSATGEIPETLRLSVRLFQDTTLDARQGVDCDLEINPSNFKFSLLPSLTQLQDAMENQLQEAILILQDHLTAETPIFRGQFAP